MGQENISTRSWGCLGGLLRRGSGDLGGRGEEGAFSTLREAPRTSWRLFRAHRFLVPPIAHLCLGLKVSLRGVVMVPMKVIVVQGELEFNDFGLKIVLLSTFGKTSRNERHPNLSILY